ncbi:MAG: pyrroline-5-carboxylate reductase, partial [Bacillota bacterium]
ATLSELMPHCRHLFIAVKPQDIEGLLRLMHKEVKPHQLITSIAAGVTIKFIEESLPPGSKVIRLMPNTACLVGEGAIAISAGHAVSEAEREEVIELLGSLGLTIPVPENLMDAVTGLSGTGPAYVFLFVETLIDAGVNVGLRRDIATALVVQTVIGAARMLQDSTLHPAELRNAVTSPAGTTCAALQVLEEEGFRSCMIKAVMKASRRAGELNHG